MSILKKIVYPICLVSILCACPITASAAELSNVEVSSVTATVNSDAETDTTTTEEPKTTSYPAKFSIANANGNVGENVNVTITADADTAFASATFVLHYDSSKLKYIDYSIPSNSGLNSDNLTRVEDTERGVVYLVLAEEDNIKNANITMTFEILSAGDTQVSLEITDMFTTDGTEVQIPPTQATGNITGIEIETEPLMTTTTESSDTTTTTTVSSTVNSSSTTTTSSQTETRQSTTSAKDNDAGATTQPSSTSNPNSSRNSTTTTTKATTTKENATTQSNSGNNGSVPTGDNFPVALLLTAIGIAGVGIIKTALHKDND